MAFDRPTIFLLSYMSKISLFIIMQYGIINRNIADLRAEPDFRSERKSQLLFNEPLEVVQLRKGYSRVRQVDGYFGWIDARSIFPVNRKKYVAHGKKLNFVITSLTAKIDIYGNSPAAGIPFLFYGTKVHLLSKIGNYCVITAPDGVKYKIALKNLTPILRSPSKDISPRKIIREAEKFLGAPYLWGGTSPYGFDCSGLVQRVYSRFGIYLPRDSKDQRKAGRRIAYDNIQCGDLLFFHRHVAIAIDKYRIIHASLGEGSVALNSLNPEDTNFRKDLSDTYLEARRVLV